MQTITIETCIEVRCNTTGNVHEKTHFFQQALHHRAKGTYN